MTMAETTRADGPSAEAAAVARDCTAGSDAGRLSFPEVVGALAAAGFERYHADLVRGEKTYFQPHGANLVVAAATAGPVAAGFDAAGVERAVRAIQAGAIGYARFCAMIAAAGCAGYHVSLAGRRAVYYGRTGETLVELFPPAS